MITFSPGGGNGERRTIAMKMHLFGSDQALVFGRGHHFFSHNIVNKSGGDGAADSRGGRDGDFSIFRLWFSIVGFGGPMIFLAAIHAKTSNKD